MAKRLSHKQRGFINDYADGATATQAALNHYDIEAPNKYAVAQVIGSENLTKPMIVEELRKLGFDSNNAKRVVGEILNDERVDKQHRLNAADKVFKVNSDYAAEKHVNINVNEEASERVRELARRLLRQGA